MSIFSEEMNKLYLEDLKANLTDLGSIPSTLVDKKLSDIKMLGININYSSS